MTQLDKARMEIKHNDFLNNVECVEDVTEAEAHLWMAGAADIYKVTKVTRRDAMMMTRLSLKPTA